MDLARANSVVAMLDHWTEASPDKVYARYLVDGETEGDVWTFSDMRRRALVLASEFAQVAQPGERALLVYPQGLEFIAAYLGCMYAGIVAVPVVPPASPKYFPKLLKIISDCSPSLLLTMSEFLGRLTALSNVPESAELAGGLAQIAHATDKVKTADVTWRRPSVIREDLAFLQYTSGSTGTPKGVMVKHGNLLANAAMIHEALGSGTHTVEVSWLPHFHDLGLIGGALTPAFLGSELILFNPAHFIEKPLRWLQAMTKYRATLTIAPNFGYDLCAKKISEPTTLGLDLSSLKAACIGAEPVRPSTIGRFSDVFHSVGFRAETFSVGYGMAETTLLISGGTRHGRVRPVSVDAELLESGQVVPLTATADRPAKHIVTCGEILSGQICVVVDPATHCPVARDQVGEIWVTGPNVAAGYWGRPAETNSAFAARLDVSDPEQARARFLRTGDLGFMLGKELVICGRTKDLIICNGRNIYPQDIEEIVETSSRHIRRGCVIAFAINDDAAGEGVAIVAEVDKRCPPEELPKVAVDLRAAVASEFQVPVTAIGLIKIGTLPKTSSGKLQRREAHKRYISKTLDLLWDSVEATASQSTPKAARTPTRPKQRLGVDSAVASSVRVEPGEIGPKRRQSDIDSFLIKWVARSASLSHDQVARDSRFAEYGLDSVAAIDLQTAIKHEFGVDIPDRALFDYGSIAELSQFLTARLQQTG